MKSICGVITRNGMYAVRCLLVLTTLALMGVLVHFLHDRSAIYPPAAALATGLLVMDRRPWKVVAWQIPRHRIHNRIPSHRHAPSLHPCHFLSNLGNMSAASGVAYHVVDLSGECPADVFIHCVALGRNQPEFVPGHGIPTNSKTWRYHFRTGTSVDADRRSHSATDAVCRIPATRSPHRTTVACYLHHPLPAWRQKAPASSPCPHHLVSCILLWCRGSDGTLEQTGSAPGYCHAADMGTCFLCDACHSCHHASFGSHQSVAICHSGRCESLSRLCYLRRCLSHGLCTD